MAAADHRDGDEPRSISGRRDYVRSVVADLEPGDQRESKSRQQILDALDELPEPFDRDAGLRHVTASAVVVGRRGTVLHMHKRLERWLQPGGHIDQSELPWEAARREGEEETGLRLEHPPGGPRLIHVDVHLAAQGHEHLDLRYLLLAEDADPKPPAGESQEVRWFSWDEAGRAADPALLGALRAARRQSEAKRQPEVRVPEAHVTEFAG